MGGVLFIDEHLSASTCGGVVLEIVGVALVMFQAADPSTLPFRAQIAYVVACLLRASAGGDVPRRVDRLRR